VPPRRKVRNAQARSDHLQPVCSLSTSFHRLGGLANRGDDSRIRAAAANIAFHESRDFYVIGVRILAQQREAGDDHSGSAIAALQGVSFEERLLKRVQAAILLKPLDGGYRFPGDGLDRGYTRASRLPIDQHRARAALSLAAAVLAAGQVKIIAQDA